MPTCQPPTRATAIPARSPLPAGPALAGTAIGFTSLYLAAGALTPLLVEYKERWGFAATQLTLAFAVYAIGFLAAVLTVGALSDHVGRRPVLIAAMLVQVASNLMFLVATDIEWVIAGRVVQGVAGGAATTAFTAALVELAPPHRKRLGATLGSVSLTGGLAAGSLLGGAAIQLTTSANTIIWWTLTIVTVLGIAATALSAETVPRTPGGLRALIPRVAVPSAARAELAAASPAIAAVWMLAGLSGGLAPSMVRSVFHLDSALLNGVSGFVAPAASAVVGLAFARLDPRRAMILGIHAAIAGPLIIIGGVLARSLPIMLVGQAVAGAGFGASFTASLRLIFPLARVTERAGVVARIYIVSYVAFGVPVVVAGRLTEPLGITTTVYWYSAATVLLACASLVAQLRIRRMAGRHKVVDR